MKYFDDYDDEPTPVESAKSYFERIVGAFVVYCKCGKTVTGCQVDLGPDDEDQDDGGMLLNALRDGRRMEYRPGSPVQVSIGGRCDCSLNGSGDAK